MNKRGRFEVDIKKNKFLSYINNFFEKKELFLFEFLFLFALTFVIFSSYIKNGVIALSGDGCGYLNLFYYGANGFHNGFHPPLWNPYMTAGRPFVTDITNCFFYPIRIIFSFLPTLTFFYAFKQWHL